jgi:hypothetical protein
VSHIGVDRWVAEAEDREEQHSGWTAPARRLIDKVPSGWRLGVFLGVVALYPFLVRPAGVRIGITVLLLALLALGLNVVVGWAGLLDLGYVAFYGFGAYFYAIVSSDQIGVHWPTWASTGWRRPSTRKPPWWPSPTCAPQRGQDRRQSGSRSGS